MLGTSEIIEAAMRAVQDTPEGLDDYWNKQGQSVKALREAMEFLEVQFQADPIHLFETAFCIGYELGKTDNGLQTFTSEN